MLSNYKIFMFIVVQPKYSNCRWEGGAPEKAQLSASGALQVCNHVQNTVLIMIIPPYRKILDPRLMSLAQNGNFNLELARLLTQRFN